MSASAKKYVQRYNYDREQAAFLVEKLGKLPPHWRKKAHEKWVHLRKQSIYAANNYLMLLTDPLNKILDIAADDGDIQKLAEDIARRCSELLGNASGDNVIDFGAYWLAWDSVKELCIGHGVRYPEEMDKGAIQLRVTDAVWWLRKLRNSHARAREMAAIDAGFVHRKGDLYCSDDTVDRRFQQLRRNDLMLKDIKLQSESGQVMKLADIAKAGVSNPDNRRAELITRITGFEQLSITYGHKAEFITVTCPSRMHSTTKDGKPNKKYDGTKPDAAQRYLVECWARCRAKLAREGVRFYGLRVCEPHHDGTPHWHLIIFYKPLADQLEKIRAAFNEHFLADSPDEKGAKENRVKFVTINPLKGTAAGYVIKYVSKNIGGLQDGEQSDEGEVSSADAYKRVEAWASTWRIRQFQQIGGHSVTVWRELRRIEESAAQLAGANIFRAWKAAQKTADHKANFAQFVEAMGGLEMPPRESRIAIHDDYVKRRGRYGDAVNRLMLGVRERFGLNKASNNREQWVRV